MHLACHCRTVLRLGYFWQSEGFPSNVLFTAATTLLIASLLVLATRRLLFATALTASLVVLVVGIARAKLETLGMILHAYDFIFYLTSWSTISYLWSGARLGTGRRAALRQLGPIDHLHSCLARPCIECLRERLRLDRLRYFSGSIRALRLDGDGLRSECGGDKETDQTRHAELPKSYC